MVNRELTAQEDRVREPGVCRTVKAEWGWGRGTGWGLGYEKRRVEMASDTELSHWGLVPWPQRDPRGSSNRREVRSPPRTSSVRSMVLTLTVPGPLLPQRETRIESPLSGFCQKMCVHESSCAYEESEAGFSLL
jgi:hypothetical protein